MDDTAKEPTADQSDAEVEPRHQSVDSVPDPQAAVRAQDGAVFAAQYKSHSGPLPGDDWLANVERLCPGATEMILTDFTEERQHQREMQRRALELDAVVVKDFGGYQHNRLLIAGGLAFFLAVCGLVLILLDRAVYGFVLLVGEIATLVGVFLVQRLVVIPDEADLDLLDDEELDELAAELEDDES